jgi:hypothetical protein
MRHASRLLPTYTGHGATAVSTVEVIARYVQALGGRIQISAVFGDDLYILRGTDTDAA